MEILERPRIGTVLFVEIMAVWIAFLLSIMVGWLWKPKWASFHHCKFDFSAPFKPPTHSFDSCADAASQIQLFDNGCEQPNKDNTSTVTDEDLEHLWHLVERKDGGPPWKHMMDHSTPTMSYQAWHRDPEIGPPQYCSRTVYDDAAPELLRDFFWDDEFRLKWDDMLVHAETIQECPATGAMIVHWVRKFPFFCSDREYIIGRRIWESGRSYYCVTKGVPCSTIPRKDKPRHVDMYYSSWYIQAVESRRGSDQASACEVILFHWEDMGLPREIAKFGIRQGMWGLVRKIERGLRSYQKSRACNTKISRAAFMAQVSTKIDLEYLKSMEGDEESSGIEVEVSPAKYEGINIRKLIIIGGAVVFACTLERGILPKALLFNVAKRFGNIGRTTPRT